MFHNTDVTGFNRNFIPTCGAQMPMGNVNPWIQTPYQFNRYIPQTWIPNYNPQTLGLFTTFPYTQNFGFTPTNVIPNNFGTFPPTNMIPNNFGYGFNPFANWNTPIGF